MFLIVRTGAAPVPAFSVVRIVPVGTCTAVRNVPGIMSEPFVASLAEAVLVARIPKITAKRIVMRMAD